MEQPSASDLSFVSPSPAQPRPPASLEIARPSHEISNGQPVTFNGSAITLKV